MSARTVRTSLLITTVLFCVHSPPGRAQGVETPPVLGVGDKIQIQVWRQPELSGEFEITSAGTIAHPLYGGIAVAGRAIPVVEEDLRQFLAHYVERPSFLIEPLFSVPVGGEVRLPSIYALPPGTTVARAVSLAGGPTPGGRLDRVTLIRNGTRYPLDLRDSGDSQSNPTIRSGDEVVVERRRDLFHEVIAPVASMVAAVVTVIGLIGP